MNRTHARTLITVVGGLLLVGCIQPIQPPAAGGPAAVPSPSAEVAAKIANAMSAAPMMIAHDATVLDWPSEPGATPVELRAGSNGWLCRPDDPATISNDPRCFDPNWQQIFGKPFGPERAATTLPGVAYMLQGGSVADNDDPTITTPPAGQEWQIDPPHLMVALPIPWDQTLVPTEHHAGGPWLMFKGTPVEHLMIPIEPVEPVDAADKIANAMSAAPMAIAKDAAILDWPSEPGATPVELRAGSNGWLCRPDDPATISNDPRCFDPNWQQIFGKPFGPEREAHTMPGVAYMLQGGSVADNDDPSVLEPAAGQEWQIDPPHIMIVSPIPWDPAVFSTDHHSGGPWVMFQGTPVEHLMVPLPQPGQ